MSEAPNLNAGYHSTLPRLARVLLPLGLLLFAAPFVVLCFYATLNTDDFEKASLAFSCIRQPGILAATWLYYANPLGSGRWFTTIVQSVAMAKTNLLHSYGWLLWTVMLSNIAALAFFLASLLRISRAKALLAASIFYCAWLASVLSPAENIFWLTEAFEYQFTITTMLVFAGLLCRPKQTTFTWITLVLLAIAVPGQHEIAGTFLCVVLLGAVIVSLLLKRPATQWWVALTLVAASFFAEMLSPGMLGKLANRPHILWNYEHLLPYAKEGAGHAADWIMAPAILICALCLPLLLRSSNGAGGTPYRPPRWLALGGLLGMGVLLGEFVSAELNSGYPQMPPRTVGWFEFVFWLLFVLAVYIGLPELSQIELSPLSTIGIAALILFSLMSSANFHAAEKDLRGPAQRWSAANTARLTQRGANLKFAPLPPRPAMFRYTALATEPHNKGCWVNMCMATYLGAETVAATDPAENPDGCGTEKDNTQFIAVPVQN